VEKNGDVLKATSPFFAPTSRTCTGLLLRIARSSTLLPSAQSKIVKYAWDLLARSLGILIDQDFEQTVDM
jgi:hypothetical protein